MSNDSCTPVLILHSDPLLSAGIAATLGLHRDLRLADPRDLAPSWPSWHATGVVVAELGQALRLARNMAHARHRPRIVVIAHDAGEYAIRRVLDAGIRGVLLHGCSADDVATAVREIRSGRRYYDPRVAQRLAESLHTPPLTERELQVLELVIDGHGNKVVARHLDIAAGTVKSHLKAIFGKLGVDSRTQAIATARRRGLLADAIGDFDDVELPHGLEATFADHDPLPLSVLARLKPHALSAAP